METSKYWIIRDTREKTGYWIGPTDISFGTKVGTLKTGDYSIEGLESRVVVERKNSTGELYGSFMQKRFAKELERLRSFEFKMLLLEFDYADVRSFPLGSGIPERRWSRLCKWGGRLLERKIIETQLSGIPIVFAGCAEKAEMYLRHFFKVVHEQIHKSG